MSTAAKSREDIPCKAPDRTVPHGKDDPIVFHIEVDPDNHTAVSSLTPAVVMFIRGDYVKWTSNSASSAIVYTEYSPFDAPAKVGEVFFVGKASNALPVERPHGSSHADCGYIDKKTGKFEKWPGGGMDGPGGY